MFGFVSCARLYRVNIEKVRGLFLLRPDIRAGGHGGNTHVPTQSGAQARRQACTQARTSDFRENDNIRFIMAKTCIVYTYAFIVNISRVIQSENKR